MYKNVEVQWLQAVSAIQPHINKEAYQLEQQVFESLFGYTCWKEKSNYKIPFAHGIRQQCIGGTRTLPRKLLETSSERKTALYRALVREPCCVRWLTVQSDGVTCGSQGVRGSGGGLSVCRGVMWRQREDFGLESFGEKKFGPYFFLHLISLLRFFVLALNLLFFNKFSCLGYLSSIMGINSHQL